MPRNKPAYFEKIRRREEEIWNDLDCNPPHGLDVGQSLLMSIADYVKIFVFLVIPLLLAAAFVEAHVTPRVVVWALGG